MPRKLIHPEEAYRRILRRVHPLSAARRALSQAAGLCLSEDVHAERDMPARDRSAMDGYAVRWADLAQCPVVLQLAGQVAAGDSQRPAVRARTCVQVFTGANVPPGADAVVPVEHTRRTRAGVTFLRSVRAGANIRRRGEEARKGDILLKAGALLGAAEVGVCAAAGYARPPVHSPPSLAILVTGNEVRDVRVRVRPHELRDSNGPALVAALQRAGLNPPEPLRVKDDEDLLVRHLQRATARHDLTIITGGVSVGQYDHVPRALARIGARVVFHGVAMKPGRPQLYAVCGSNRHIFALPGNPLSVLTGFFEFVLPAIRRLSGAPVSGCRCPWWVPVSEAMDAEPDRTCFILARLDHAQGRTVAVPLVCRGSADIAAAAHADGVIVVAPGCRKVRAGTSMEFRPWRSIP